MPAILLDFGQRARPALQEPATLPATDAPGGAISPLFLAGTVAHDRLQRAQSRHISIY
jgi:hypothetical protein